MGSNTPLPNRVRKVSHIDTILSGEKKVIMSQSDFGQSPIVEGKLLKYEIPKAMTLYAGNSLELADSQVMSSTTSCIIITLVLSGKLHFGYDDLSFQLDGDKEIEVVAVNLAKVASFSRSLLQGNQLSKLNLILYPNWIAERIPHEEPKLPLLQRHLNHARFSASPELIELAKAIINHTHSESFSAKLHLESLALQLAATVFKQLPDDTLNSTSPTDEGGAKLGRIEEWTTFIETQLSNPLSLKLLANHFSTSESNLQRVFKKELGTTVNNYIRKRRLKRARHNLEQGVSTIKEASYEAGYNHPANFTNAFQKEFGVPPNCVLKG